MYVELLEYACSFIICVLLRIMFTKTLVAVSFIESAAKVLFATFKLQEDSTFRAFESNSKEPLLQAPNLIASFRYSKNNFFCSVILLSAIYTGLKLKTISFLFRAVYYDADVYLMDDPLSAVDSIVGRRIFDE